MPDYQFDMLINALDSLTCAVKDLDQSNGPSIPPAPIRNIVKRIDDLLALDRVTGDALGQLSDARSAVFTIYRRIRGQLQWVLQNRTTIPDPGTRTCVSFALRTNKTNEALGALLRIDEWLAEVEAKYPVLEDI